MGLIIVKNSLNKSSPSIIPLILENSSEKAFLSSLDNGQLRKIQIFVQDSECECIGELIGDKPEAKGVKERSIFIACQLWRKISVHGFDEVPKPGEIALSIFWERTSRRKQSSVMKTHLIKRILNYSVAFSGTYENVS